MIIKNVFFNSFEVTELIKIYVNITELVKTRHLRYLTYPKIYVQVTSINTENIEVYASYKFSNQSEQNESLVCYVHLFEKFSAIFIY